MNVKLTKINHFLANAKDFTDMELAQVTDKDLAEFTLLSATLPADLEADLEEAIKVQTVLVNSSEELYGTHSNQHKYALRNWSKGLDIVHSHYDKYEKPQSLRYRVETARNHHNPHPITNL